MKIDYNDGKWHGWNNDGPCPVHPKSIVHVLTASGAMVGGGAYSWGWDGDEQPIVAFRVLKVYQEPVSGGEIHQE